MKCLIWLCVLCGILAYTVNAICGVCYGAHACIGRNQFQVCVNNVIDTSRNYTCSNSTQVCTQYGEICMEPTATVEPACGDTSQCNICNTLTDFRFSCLSRTTFTQCFTGAAFGSIGTCPNGELCTVSNAAIGMPCANSFLVNSTDICDRNADYNTTTTTMYQPTPTPSSSSTTSSISITTQPPANVTATCESVSAGGRYAYLNDTSCTSYINCFWRNGTLHGINLNCPSSLPYFNATATTCGANKPSGSGCV